MAAVLDDEASLQALAGEWAALWAEVPGATPFQHPAWLLPWWAAFGTGAPLVATWREGGRLRGVLPAYVHAEAGRRKLLPIGAGTTDYLDGLGAGTGAMLAGLLARAEAEGVERFDLMDVPPGAGLLGAVAPDGWRASWSEGNACPVLVLAGGLRPTPGPSLSGRGEDRIAPAWRKLRMNRNRAERAGGWAVEEVGPGGLDVLVALHQARWAAVGEPGVLADAAVLRCLRLALPALETAGLLRVQVLRVGGGVAAAVMALLAPGRLYFYASGYDARHSFVSPGTLLVGAMLEQAAAEERTEAHFLRGREGYKYAWGAVDRFNAGGSFTRA